MTARRVLGALLAGSLLVAGCSEPGSGSTQDDKQLITFQGPGFSIKLPGEPTTTTQTVSSPSGDLEVVFYAVKSSDAAVAVAVTTVPKGVPADLDGAVEGGAANVGGVVQSSQPITVDGLQGRDAVFTSTRNGRDYTAFLRILASGRRVVQVVQEVAGDDTTPPDSYAEILDSLEIG